MLPFLHQRRRLLLLPRKFSSLATQRFFSTSTLTTLSRPVDFPPHGSRSFFLLCVFSVVYGWGEASSFLQTRERVEDLGRQLRPAFFSPSHLTRNLLELNFLANNRHAVGPNMFPRLLAHAESIAACLNLDDTQEVRGAAAELLATLSSKPHAAKQLAPIVFPPLLSALFKAVPLEGGQVDQVLLPPLLRLVENLLPFVPPDDVQILGGVLDNLAQHTLVLHGEADNAYFMAALHLREWLLRLSLKAPPGLCDNYMLEYAHMAQQEMGLEEHEALYLSLALFHLWERHPDTSGWLREELERDVLFKFRPTRRLVQMWLDKEELIADVVSALFFGQVWGMGRTLMALRHVAMPATETSSLMWRWKMAGKYGALAGFGAMVLTLTSHALQHLEVTAVKDANQVAAFLAKLFGGLVVTRFFLTACPFCLLPAFLVDSVVLQDEMIEFNVPSTFRKRDGGEWT